MTWKIDEEDEEEEENEPYYRIVNGREYYSYKFEKICKTKSEAELFIKYLHIKELYSYSEIELYYITETRSIEKIEYDLNTTIKNRFE